MGTLILGVLWGLWHGPFYFGPLSLTGPDATFVSTGIAFVEYLIGATGFAVVMTRVFNNTGGSVLMAILLHTSIDVAFAFAVLWLLHYVLILKPGYNRICAKVSAL